MTLLDGQTIYSRAAEHLKAWRREGVLKTDNVRNDIRLSPVVRIRRPVFQSSWIHGSGEARAVWQWFDLSSRRNPFPREGRSFQIDDRMSVKSESDFWHLSRTPQNQVQEILEDAIQDRTPLQATDDQGVEHKMWMVTDTKAIATAAQLMGPKPIYIADGHHRYETACNIQAAIRESEHLEGDQPVDYVMMMCVSMQDPGMAILPTHRLFRGVRPIPSDELIDKLSPAFACEVVGHSADYAGDLWDLIAVEDEQSTMGFYCRADDTWVLSTLD